MTEETGQCPSHKADTQGSDSYSWNTEKKQGHCLSCGLKTWEYNGKVWGKHEGGKTFELRDDSSVHIMHCNQGEYEGSCKYGDDSCPTLGYGRVTTGEEEDEDVSFVPKDITSSDEAYVGWRGVSKDTMEEFGVVTISDKIVFRYPNGGTKTRLKSDKKFYAENLKSDELYAMNKFPAGCSKKVTVTEGELDALSAWQMLHNGNYLNPVVSVPSANPSGKLWEKCKKWLDSFDEIILSVDNDGPGKKLAEKFSLMFPGKVFIMDHGQYKDANDFLMNGEAKLYKNLWWKAKRYKPDDMRVDAEDYLRLYKESPDFEYFPTGVPQLDEKILGICKGYFTVIQAPTGVGKTEVMRYLEYQCLTTSNYKFAYMHLEESELRSLLGLVSYKLNDNLTLKKFIEDKGREEEVLEAIEELTSSERMIQFSHDPSEGYESLLSQIKYLVAAFDVDYVFFEPIQDLVHGEDKEGKLADLSARLGVMSSDLGVGIVTIAHQNQNGDTMYATMIGKKAAFEILLKRDQDAEDLTEKNRTYITVGRKNRVGLGNGPAGALDFGFKSYTLQPVQPPKPPETPNREDF